MKVFYKIATGALSINVMFKNRKQYIDEPKMLLKLAKSLNPKAQMKDLKAGQFDWNNALFFQLSISEAIEILYLFKKVTKNFTLPIRSKDNIWNHVPEKGVSVNFYHKRKNNSFTKLIVKIKPYHHKKSEKYVLTVSIIINKDDKDKALVTLTSGISNEFMEFYYYIKSFCENSLLLSDMVKFLSFNNHKNKNKTNNMYEENKIEETHDENNMEMIEDDDFDSIDDIEI